MTHTEPQNLVLACIRRTADIHFWAASGEVDSWSSGSFNALVSKYTAGLRRRKICVGDLIALGAETTPHVLACIVAAWSCRASVCLVPLPRTSRGQLLDQLLELLDPRLFIVEAGYLACSGSHPCVTFEVLRNESATPEEDEFDMPDLRDVAVIQLTSGSTSTPKGVLVTHGMLAENCSAIAARVQMRRADHVVSWLPLNHDMGLSAFTVPLFVDVPTTLISPADFVRSPVTWLRAISEQRATVSPSPAFAFDVLTRAASRLERARLDLSTWRYAWVGAEPVFPTHLESFFEATKAYGFQRQALKPAYGLAEAVVAVTCEAPENSYRLLHVDAEKLRSMGTVQPIDEGPNSLSFVSNGKPLSNVRVRVKTAQQVSVVELQQGEIQISGPSVTRGYLNNVNSGSFEGEWFNTGDLGFLHKGDLYISGRIKDVIIRGGQNFSPERIEAAVQNLLELRPGTTVAFSHVDHTVAKETVIVLVGKRVPLATEAEARAHVAASVTQQVGLQVDDVVFTSHSLLPRTSSGKVQRGRTRDMYLAGNFSSAIKPT